MEDAVNRKALKSTTRKRCASQPEAPQVAPAAYTVPEFCAAHKISRALLYILLRDNRGPRLLKAGRRTLITLDAASDWRRRMEAAGAGDAR